MRCCAGTCPPHWRASLEPIRNSQGDDILKMAGFFSWLALATTISTAAWAATPASDGYQCVSAGHDPVVRLETGQGNIDVQLARDAAPLSVCNFLHYVQAHLFDGGTFFRTVREDNQRTKPVKIGVIQAEMREDNLPEAFAPIPLERTSQTGILHVDGAISMARDGPDTATSSFSICIDAQPELNFGGKRNPDGQGFAAFGRVIRGMDVARKIQAAPASGEQLTPAVQIRKAYVLAAEEGDR
jgi:peptidyl-prolyl cis-trans isomerase A (cyclophilin A)